MRVALIINGRERSFSEQELVDIIEKHLSVNTAKEVEMPTEGAWFEVNPQAINQELFNENRIDSRQEETRQIIVQAFDEMKKMPEKYSEPFKTLIPKKEWSYKTVAELKEYATQIGGHMADWVEQGIEWAQRIANGESWESICNEPDRANWYRLVVWKNGYVRPVGGSRCSIYSIPATYVNDFECKYYGRLDDTVPLVVKK